MKSSEASIRVMLVDDHQTLLWGLEKLVQGQKPKMEVAGTARSCEEAVTKSRELAPDVVLLDLDLNGECSLDIIPVLLSNSSARVLILTAGYDRSVLDMAVLRGARGVLYKTEPAEQVIKAIEKVHLGELWLDQQQLGRVFGEMIASGGAHAAATGADTLTARERDIVDIVVQANGASNKMIAQRLFISEHTLRNHLTSIYQKLGVGNRLELYVYATKHRLVGAKPAGYPHLQAAGGDSARVGILHRA
jgi:DNA-binding NarL/FixJ family response regulator